MAELHKMYHIMVVSSSRIGQGSPRTRLSSMVEHSFMMLRMQKVLVLEITSCSADLHKDLAEMSLKLKFRMNGHTYLKSKVGKTTLGVNDKSSIRFDNFAGSAVYEGGELFHFELCKVGRFTASETLACCGVPAMKVFASVGNGTKGADLNLELKALDMPGKVLANLTVRASLRTSTLDDVGGFQMLKLLKLPSEPLALSGMSGFSYDHDSQEILDFIDRIQRVTNKLEAVHDVTMEALAARPRDASRSSQLVEMFDDIPMDEVLRQPIASPQGKLSIARQRVEKRFQTETEGARKRQVKFERP